MSVYITSIGTANPKYKIGQQEVLSFMIDAHGMNGEEAKKLEALYRATGISNRYSVLDDFKQSRAGFFNNGTPPSTQHRNQLYRQEALGLAFSAVENCLQKMSTKTSELTHLISVSCTGMYAPGLEIDLVKKLGLRNSIKRTAINFMGCYAAFTALRLAYSICNSENNAKVLVVCSELCTLHFQQKTTEDNLLSNALFGDGSAAVLIENEPAGNVSLEMKKFQSDLISAGENEMAWNISDFGFEMKLSSYVPDVIKTGISSLINNLDTNINYDFFAIHPGGKRILRIIEEELNIVKEDNQYAHDVLRQYGNMSSPTVIFVLEEISKSLKPSDHGKNVLGLAFGPGLTLESMNLQIHLQ